MLVELYPGKEDHEIVKNSCGRCGGQGYIYTFRYNADGICFQCGGTGGREVTVGSLRQAAEKAARKEAMEKQRLADFKAEYPHLAGELDGGSEFIISLVKRIRKGKGLTEAQMNALENRVQTKAEAVEVPEGRYTITGKVQGIKKADDYYNPGKFTYKWLVVSEEGFKVWGTIPAKLVPEVDTGMTVRFTATVKRTESGLGIASRPAAAEVL